ncbi:MAG: 4'-phosphopantetheinyl transferase superfamily protein [Tannerella sp.]|nr:4'-phosphopantetheinyl transferase superfamily protein [Tannerella sp.]
MIEKNTMPLRGVWKIDETADELLDFFKNEEDVSRAALAIRSENRRREWLAVRRLTDTLLGKRSQITYEANGSPVLPDSSFKISISHTKGFAAVVLSEFQRTGIDIEYHSERAFRLRNRFLGPAELNVLASYGNNKDLATVFWCAKESFFKALGRQGVDFIKDMHIISSPSFADTEGEFLIEESITPDGRICSVAFTITPDYILTWMT